MYSATLQLLWAEGIAGALYIEDFKRLARTAGFTVPRALNAERITITDAELAKEVACQAGDVTFCSITYRMFKLPGLLESLGEEYGQVATYKVREHPLQHYMEPISTCHRSVTTNHDLFIKIHFHWQSHCVACEVWVIAVLPVQNSRLVHAGKSGCR